MKWILASGSPRRQQLLCQITEDFSVLPSQIEERRDPSWTAPGAALSAGGTKGAGCIVPQSGGAGHRSGYHRIAGRYGAGKTA